MYYLNPRLYLPKWAFVYASVLVFMLEKRWAIAVGLVAAIFLLTYSGVSYAMCDTIPERHQNLCEQLGYEPECKLCFEEGKKVNGVLEITVDDYVSEPDVEPILPDVRATAVRLTTKDAEAVQIYLPLSPLGGDQLKLSFLLRQAPCPFITCVRKRDLDPYHQGLSEEQLVDFNQVIDHVLFQTGDSLQIAEFQDVYDAVGIPTITKVNWDKAEFIDQTYTYLASVLRVPVKIQFAIPAKE